MNKKECIKYVEDHLEVQYATSNRAYKAGRNINPNGCVNHSVGCAQPNVDVFFNLMNKDSCGWGVSALLGDFHKGEGRIILVMPLNRRNWGCGAGKNGSWNNTRVQWEVCEPAGHTYAGGTMIGYDVEKNQPAFDRMWKMLVAWNVYCAVELGYDTTTVNDHAESYRAGYGSNHSDMGHWLSKHGKSMNALRTEVKAILEEKDEPDSTPDAWAEEAVENAINRGILFGDGTGNLMLHKECTRQEMVVFLHRYYKYIMKNI